MEEMKRKIEEMEKRIAKLEAQAKENEKRLSFAASEAARSRFARQRF